MRRGFVLFALLALSVVMARPICDLHQFQGNSSQSGSVVATGHVLGEAPGHEGSEPCCGSVQDGTLAVLAAAVTPVVKSPVFLLVATVSLPGWRAAASSPAAAILAERSPASQPYHVRSARILS